jgi:thiol-disulfide isomerase/thioredoxin
MFPKQNPRYGIITNLVFAAATCGSNYACAQTAPEPPAATAPAKAELTLRVEDFSEKFRDEIRQAIATEHDKTIVVVFSVPKKCPACDAYKPQLDKLAEMLKKEGSTTKMYVVNFTDFQQVEDSTMVIEGNHFTTLAPQVPRTLIFPKLPSEIELSPPSSRGKAGFVAGPPWRPGFGGIGSVHASKLSEILRSYEKLVTQEGASRGTREGYRPDHKWLNVR